jgi:CcmD family protein
MHQNLGYLFAAFAVTWVVLFAYLAIIQRMLTDAGKRLRALESAEEPSTRSERRINPP